MAAWRVYLTDQTVRRLDLIQGKPAVLAAWTQTGRVFYFDVANGTRLGERVFEPIGLDDRGGEAWKTLVAGLTAPNGGALPVIRLAGAAIHTSADGHMRLVQVGANALYLDLDGKEVRLHTGTDVTFAALAFDRSLGLVAALDSDGRLHTYQQHIRVGIFDVGLSAGDEFRPAAAVTYGGASIFATDGTTLVLSDSSGHVRKRAVMHYPIGALASSPDGRLVATTDTEIGIIRIYNGADLQPTHQRFAADLLVEARRAQLMGGALASGAALSALTLNNKGVLSFAMSGTICVSNVARMGAMPHV